jgi:hypothetical protein
VARIFSADGLAARLDARGEEEREGKRERLRSGFIGRCSVVERKGEVHAGTDQRRRSGCDDDKRRRRAARADGRAAWQGGERPARVGEAAAWTLGRHVARFRAAQGGRCSAHGWRSGGGASGREKSEQSRAEGLKVDEGTDSQFSKNAGTPL